MSDAASRTVREPRSVRRQQTRWCRAGGSASAPPIAPASKPGIVARSQPVGGQQRGDTCDLPQCQHGSAGRRVTCNMEPCGCRIRRKSQARASPSGTGIDSWSSSACHLTSPNLVSGHIMFLRNQPAVRRHQPIPTRAACTGPTKTAGEAHRLRDNADTRGPGCDGHRTSPDN